MTPAKRAEQALREYLAELTGRDTNEADEEQAGRLCQLAQQAYGVVYNSTSKAEIKMLVGMKWGFR